MSEEITEDQVSELLYKYTPEFKTVLEDELDDEERKMNYLVAGTFARFLLDGYKSGNVKQLESAAKFIEELHLKGSETVKNLATVGYLEGIQNVWGNNGVDPSIFYGYLLAESQKWWLQLNKFWNGEIKEVGETISQEN